MWVDDVTPEKLAGLLADQGGRMLQASAEGTLFEIVKGRYAEGGKANVEVYLKGHAGDALRVDRVGRPADVVERPALSVALAVQPDVIRGLAERATLKHRGFLARWMYALPVSLVGRRTIAARPVPAATTAAYRKVMMDLWRTEQASQPLLLAFSPQADQALRDLEGWLEPQLAEGEELSLLAGWANKLAGACARIAGILHLAGGLTCAVPIPGPTAAAAIRLGREYLLPHAQAAFGLMAADEKLERLRKVWQAAVKLASECSESSECRGARAARVSRRDLHQAVRRRTEFASAEEIDPAIDGLVERHYLHPIAQSGTAGKGHKSPLLLVSPKALALEG
jgi:hypothetical protein